MSLNWKHPGVRIGTWLIAGLVAVALIWFLIGRLFPDNPQGPTKNEKTADSLDITRPMDKALIDSSNARIAARGPATARAEADARAAENRAARNRRIADSLAVMAREAADSAVAWHKAYDARELEAVDLRKTVTSNATVITNLKADTTDLRTQLGIVSRRLEKTEAVVVGLRWDLQQARKCKIIGFINCPSRIQTAALTAVAVIAVDRYRSR